MYRKSAAGWPWRLKTSSRTTKLYIVVPSPGFSFSASCRGRRERERKTQHYFSRERLTACRNTGTNSVPISPLLPSLFLFLQACTYHKYSSRRRARVATYSGQISYAYYLPLSPNHRLLDFSVVVQPSHTFFVFFFLCFLRFLQCTLSFLWMGSPHLSLVLFLFCSCTIYLTEQRLCPNFGFCFVIFFFLRRGFRVAGFPAVGKHFASVVVKMEWTHATL